MTLLTDPDLLELAEHSYTFQCSRGKVLTERLIAEVRALRSLAAAAETVMAQDAESCEPRNVDLGPLQTAIDALRAVGK